MVLETTARQWRSALETLQAEWELLRSHPRDSISQWEQAFAEIVADTRQIAWVSGPSDLLGVIGRHRDELTHSAVLAWLLTPSGRHGFRDRLLRRVLEEGWPDSDLAPSRLDTVVVRREVSAGARRADITVEFDGGLLVVENKVDAPESPLQCEDLYRWWTGDPSSPPDIRFLLVSPTGAPPKSTASLDAAEAWRSVSYPAIAALLTELLGSVDGERPSLTDYLETVRAQFRDPADFAITQGGGHVDVT